VDAHRGVPHFAILDPEDAPVPLPRGGNRPSGGTSNSHPKLRLTVITSYLACVEMRKIAPKFPGDGSLGPVDLDNEFLRTSKPDKFGRTSVDLFSREKIRHRSVLGF
jgi:hypothetical protein